MAAVLFILSIIILFISYGFYTMADDKMKSIKSIEKNVEECLEKIEKEYNDDEESFIS